MGTNDGMGQEGHCERKAYEVDWARSPAISALWRGSSNSKTPMMESMGDR